MHACKFCKTTSELTSGDYAIHTWTDNFRNYPVSETYQQIVQVINPKCLYSNKSYPPSVSGHDYICRDPAGLTIVVERDKIKKIEDPTTILKEMITR